jgi:hypothetical protein
MFRVHRLMQTVDLELPPQGRVEVEAAKAPSTLLPVNLKDIRRYGPEI